ncbi:MAG: ribbon-helix-helix domain-containing protein [Thermoplasmata archaeon]
MEATTDTTATIDTKVWKVLDLLHDRTKIPKKHLIRHALNNS